MKRILHVLIVPLLLCTSSLFAQVSNEFQIANRLMQQQRYEDALPILRRAHQAEPQIFLFLDRLVECHIQLKQYEEAVDLLQRNIRNDNNTALSNVILGEVYHYKGDTEQAYSVWQQNLAANPDQLQVYINTANSMVDRREYERAVEVYRKGRAQFNNEQLFLNDIPNAYMQAGNYEAAIDEWLTLIQKDPRQTTAIQRMLLRYDDPLLYDITILELEDKLIDMPLSSPAYQNFYELQIWLLLENELFRRAFTTAREYENKTSAFNFSLFNVGRKLAQNSEFELALDAFSFYTETSFGEVKWRAMEEKAEVYTRWAKYLDNYSLDFTGKRDSLFNNARELLNELAESAPNYSRIENVYLQKAELSLDFVFDLESARESTQRLKMLRNMNDTPESNYLDGRIALAEQQYTNARISLTRSNKQAEIGELAEKTRYFLALTDFYAGDYEFAKIQLKTLGRQNTSYYANDALELRLWLQEGLAADTTGTLLNEFSRAYFDLKNGKTEEAKREFLAIANSDTPTPFKDDAYILLSKAADDNSVEYFITLNNYLLNSPFISQKEHLMWERAKLAEQLYLQGVTTIAHGERVNTDPDMTNNGGQEQKILETVIRSYEEIILHYPQGFYAPYARQRLNELPKVNS